MLMELENLRTYSLFLYEERGLSLAAKEALARWYTLAKERGAYDDQIQALLVSGLNWLQMKRADEALDSFEKALAVIEAHGKSSSVTKLHVLFDIALAHDQKGNVDQALLHAEEVWQTLRSTGDSENYPQVALLLGKLYIARECWSKAYHYSRKALTRFDRSNDVNGRSRALNNLGLICVETGDYDQAEVLLNESLQQKQMLNDARSVYTLTELGRLHYKKGDLAEAVHFSRMALQTLWESVAFMDKAEVARLCRLFGSVAAKTGDRQGAIAYLQRAITYYGQLGQWREWSAVTKEMDELIHTAPGSTINRVNIGWRDKESLRNLTTLLGLMDTLEGLYPELRGKSELVTKYALLLGDACGITETTRRSLSHAARLANIGATFPGVDGEARNTLLLREQPGELPVLAERVLGMVSVSDECRIAVRHQHERYDGSGYPDALRSEAIPLISRILAIVDAYVTRASTGGGELQLHEQAMQHLITHAGTRFDPELVNVFSSMHESRAHVVV